MQARVEILLAKHKINRAIAGSGDEDLDMAGGQLAEAVSLVKDARKTLGDDEAYQNELDAVDASLRDAVSAVKAKAADVRARIEQVVSDSDALISSLESQEQKDEVSAK